MVLKKKLLTVFYKALSEARTDLAKDHISLADARIRDGLASKALFDTLKDFEDARTKIYKAFCKKDANGEPELVAGNYQFDPKDVDAMNKEVKILEDEEVDLKVDNPAKIVQFLNNTKYEPRVGEALIIDEVIELLAPNKPEERKADGN